MAALRGRLKPREGGQDAWSGVAGRDEQVRPVSERGRGGVRDGDMETDRQTDRKMDRQSEREGQTE